MADERKGLSYVVPAYNEEGGIQQTLERLDDALSSCGLDYEIIVVNDGSRDNTAAIAASIPNVRLISHPTNCGYGGSIKSGIRHARYSWIGIVDADGTYPIEELPRLIEKMEMGFDMVVAKRANVLQMDAPIKRFFRSLFIAVVSFLVNKHVEDPNSGFRLFRADLARLFMPFLCQAFSFTTSLTVFSFGNGMFISYVPIEYHPRVGKSHVRHIRDSLRTAQLVLQGLMYFNPVKMALLASAVFVVGGFLPATGLASQGFVTAGAFYLAAFAVACVMILLGLLFDMLRIATIQSSLRLLGKEAATGAEDSPPKSP